MPSRFNREYSNINDPGEGRDFESWRERERRGRERGRDRDYGASWQPNSVSAARWRNENFASEFEWDPYERRANFSSHGFNPYTRTRDRGWAEPHEGYEPSDWGTPRGQYSGRGPKGYRRSDERIREEVCDRLTEHPAIDASDIEIDVKDSEVYLSGNVAERRMKRWAEDVVEQVSGVIDVHNHLRVGTYEPQRREETTAPVSLRRASSTKSKKSAA